MNEIPPVEISITVRCGVDDAFRLFTEGIGTWWPMRMHSVGEDRTVDVVIEGRNGGAVYELTSDGERHVWALSFSASRQTESVSPGIPGAAQRTQRKWTCSFKLPVTSPRCH